jgi:hypothetical protein
VVSGDEEARKRQAEEWRKEIASIERGDETEDDSGEKEPESPRDFTEREAREEAERQKKSEE